MTLEALQYLVTDLALKRNLVNCSMSGPSIYAINPEDIKEYPVIFVSPTGSHTIKENTTRYSLTIFFMDRLLEDSSNEESINSAGIETLRNLKLQLSKIEVVTDIQEDVDIRLFTETERMADRVAGAYMTIWVETLNPSTCPAFFDEYGYYMGNYFATEGLEAVLDDLASKEWVNRLIASISVSGITPEEFERIMGDYVLRRNFATINGSGITNRQAFNLVEQGDYDEQVQQINNNITAITQEVQNVENNVTALTQEINTVENNITAITQDIQEINNNYTAITENITAITENLTAVTQEIQNIENNYTAVTQEIQEINNNYTAITENITVISGDTTQIEQDITTLSASTTQEIQNIYQAISAATPSDYDAVKSQVSANTQNIADLSGATSSAVSSLTQDIETLSAAISGYTPQGYEALKGQVSANTEDISELSGITSGLTTIVEQLQAEGNLVFIIDQNSTQADINALVDAALDTGATGNDQWAKITLLYKTNAYNGPQYVVLRPYLNYRPRYDYDAYFVGFQANNYSMVSLYVVGFSKNTMQQGVDRRDYDLSKFVPKENFRTVNGQTLIGAGYGDITVGNVRSTTVATIVSLTQIEYDQLATKDPNTLYIIVP